MGKVILPRLNQTGANEWADVQTNDEAIATVVNGEISNENIAANAAIARSKLEPGAQGIPGTTYPAVIIATEQSTSSAAFVKLATPDEVTGVVLPANGLIRVGYIAIWSSTVANAGKAILSLSGVGALPTAGSSSTEAATNGTSTTYLSTLPTGGPLASGRISTLAVPVAFSMVEIFAPAGTYSVGVSFAATSGTVTVKERKLWVSVTTF